METLVNIPTWLRLVVLFVGMYLVYKLWSAAVRARQELQATSWILKERRRAGIPDSDKRPFKIAKADVEEKQRVTSKSRDSDLRLRQPREKERRDGPYQANCL
ncbi:hypothetical protein BY996DRAFT_7416364 [Phakopsora pachyrhizi]|nr:hypothetical protein BY996DRAFT_7416364 [Phakopsora pachyrhizi]